MKEFSGLKGLRNTGAASGVYCPKCGNYLEITMNGWFHGEVFYCPGDKQVYVVQLRATKVSPEFLKQAQEEIEVEKVRPPCVFMSMKREKNTVYFTPNILTTKTASKQQLQYSFLTQKKKP